MRSAVALVYPDPGRTATTATTRPTRARTAGRSIDEAELERQEQLAEDAARRQALLDVVGSATTLLIAGPLYVYHWRRVQSELPGRNGQDVAGGPPAP